MTNQGPAAVGWVDYILIVASLGVCVYIGLRKPKGPKKPQEDDANEEAQEQTIGGRSMGMLPVAFSIMATVLSGNSITSAIGETYKYGIITMLIPLSGMLAKLFIAYAIVPVLHAYPYVSIYEYIEKRFDRSFRLIFSSLYIVSHVIYLGIALYSPALSLTTVTGIPYWITVSALGLVCAFYCVIGGLKAIIWTDVFQSGLMFFSVVTVIVQAVWAAGGVVPVFQKSFESPLHMTVHFPYTEDPTFRYSVWAVLFAGAVDTFKSTLVSQAGAQRLLCVDSVKTAAKSLMVGGILVFFFKLLTTFAALAIYASLKDCDPLTMPEKSKIANEDQLFMFVVNKYLSHIPGLQGLVLAGLIGATLSTCSSLINAFAVLTLEDFAKPLLPRWTENGQVQVLICKLSTLAYALLAIAISFCTPYMGGIAKALMGFIASLIGPLAGVMLLAFFSKRSKSKACKIAFVISLAFVCWIMVGSWIYPKRDETLPKGLRGCPTENFTFQDEDAFEHVTALNNNNSQLSLQNDETEFKNTTSLKDKSKYVFPLYKISFMWLGPIGMAMTCVVGLVISYIMGGETHVDELFLSPWVTKSCSNSTRKSETRRWFPWFSRGQKTQASYNHEVLLPDEQV